MFRPSLVSKNQHQDLSVRFVTPQFGRQKTTPRLASTICYAPVWSAKTNTKTCHYDLLRPSSVSKNQHQDLPVRFVTPQLGQQKPTPRLANTICYAPIWSAKTNTKSYHYDLLRPSLVSKTNTNTYQYDLLRPSSVSKNQHQDLPVRFTPQFGQQKPTPRLTSTICYATIWSAKTNTKTYQYDLLRPNLVSKTNTNTYQYDLLRPSSVSKNQHQDLPVRFVTPQFAEKPNTKTYQYDLLRPSLVSRNQHQDLPVRFVTPQFGRQKPTPRLANTICYAPAWSAKTNTKTYPVRFVTLQFGQQKPTPRLTQYDLLRPSLVSKNQHQDLPVRFATLQFGQQEPTLRLTSTISYAPVWSAKINTKTYQYDLRPNLVSKNQHQDLPVRLVTPQFGQQKPTPRLTSTICYAPVWSAKTNTKTYQYDLLRPSLVSKNQQQDLPIRFGTPQLSWVSKNQHQDLPLRFVMPICYAPVRSAKTNTKTYQYDFLRPSLVSKNQHQDLPLRFVTPQFGQQKPTTRLANTICYAPTWSAKTTPRLTSTICYAPVWSARTNTKTYQYDFLRPSLVSKNQHQDLPVRFATLQFGQQEPTPRLTSTICYAPVWSAKTNTKTYQYDLLRSSLVSKTNTKTHQYDLLRPSLVSKNQHQDLPVRFVTPQFGQQKPTPRLTSTICYAPVRSAKTNTKTYQYDFLRPSLVSKNQHQDLPVRFLTAQFGQQKPTPRLLSTICYAPVWSEKTNNKTCQYDLVRPN